MTIPFEVWIDGIVGSAKILANHDILERVWVRKESCITSITNFDEAYEQIFSDLDANFYLEKYLKDPSLSSKQKSALVNFVNLLFSLDDSPFRIGNEFNSEALLNSQRWKRIEDAAKEIDSLWPARL